jgi:hypothetical protein
MKYTDTQLKQALAKMLPEQIEWHNGLERLHWKPSHEGAMVFSVHDTELLHLCWLVEKTLTEYQSFDYSCDIKYHATWQQRTIALCKVKKITISPAPVHAENF